MKRISGCSWLFGLCLLLISLSGCAVGPGQGIPFPSVTPLHGWEYHWGNVKTPPESGWQVQDPPLNPPGRQGNPWLWLRVRLPQLQPYDSLYLRGIDENFEVYLQQHKIYGFGEMPPTSRYYSGFPWHMIALSPAASEQYLYFRIYSPSRHIGIFGQPRIGAPAAHLQNMLSEDLNRLVVGCLLIFLALLVFLLFVRQPIKGYRLLALAALSLGVYLICRTEIKQIYGDAPVLWKWIEYLALFTGAPAICWFLNLLFGGNRSWQSLLLLQLAVEVLSLMLAALGVVSLQAITQPFLLLTLANMALGLGIVLLNFRRHGSTGAMVLAGAICMSAFTGYDILASLRWVPWVRPVSHWGLLLMVLAMMLALKEQVDKVYHDKRVAEESSRSKSEFLASVSHEIRTPLNAILGFSDLLSKDLAENSQASEYLDIIRRAGRTLLLLINDILDLSRIEARRMPVHPRPMSLPALLADIRQLFMLSMQEKGLNWEVHSAAGVPEHVMLDDARLRQILLNLVGNAQKFTPAGYVRLSLTVLPAEQPDYCQLHFEVADSGIGIPEHEHKPVFDAFYQVERNDRRAYGGTGLGLSISHRLAELLGGSLRVSSQPEQGTCFTLDLPEVPILSQPELVEVDNTPAWLAGTSPLALLQTPAELPEAVRQPLLLQLRELQQNKSISRIQKYADELQEAGSRIDSPWLQGFGERLKEAVRAFDIGEINALLDQLAEGLKG